MTKIGSDVALVEPVKTICRRQFMEISFFFSSTTALATDNHHFPPFQLQKFTFDVKKFQPGERKWNVEGISLISACYSHPTQYFLLPYW